MASRLLKSLIVQTVHVVQGLENWPQRAGVLSRWYPDTIAKRTYGKPLSPFFYPNKSIQILQQNVTISDPHRSPHL